MQNTDLTHKNMQNFTVWLKIKYFMQNYYKICKTDLNLKNMQNY